MLRLIKASSGSSGPSTDFWCRLIVFYELAGEKLCGGILSKRKDDNVEIQSGLEKFSLNNYSSKKSIDCPKFTLSTFTAIMEKDCFAEYHEIANYLKDERFKLFLSKKTEYTFKEYKDALIKFEKMCKKYWEKAFGKIKLDLTSLKSLKKKVRFFLT